ncbi:MAG: hypothetical protein K2Q06_15270, partial [Parvularculaceae bacterium]|nr:hypothetical protein [Parvularculaceae bacterium]
KKLGKKVYMTLQGCDIRMAARSNARNEFTMCADGKCSFYKSCVDQIDATRQWLADNVLPLCDHVFYLNPELGHEVPNGSFIPYMSVDIDRFAYRPLETGARPRIVHAPSDPNIKGSKLILDALDALKSEFDFELVLVQNKPYEEAIKIYETADIAIDQILAGWYGGLAVELMAMGKPVMCYIRDEDMRFIPPKMRAELPLLQARPDTIKEDIRRVLASREQWPAWSRASRAFAERWHDPVKLARATLACYRDPANRFDLESILAD